MACPTDTYAEDTGATALILCQKCQDKSSTQGLTGQNSSRACACDKEYYLVTSLAGTADETLSCQKCPKGAECGDSECALRNPNVSCSDGTRIAGVWEMNNGTGKYKLRSCPTGFEMRTSEEQQSEDLQQCLACNVDSFGSVAAAPRATRNVSMQ